MEKNLFLILTSLLIFWLILVIGNGNYAEKMLSKAEAATTANVTLSGTVLQYLAITIPVGSTINFSNITPGTPKCGDVNSRADVTTNASGGYSLLTADGSATNSPMVHSDTTTYIPDITGGTIASPIVWVTGQTGLGFSLFSGTQKSTTKWGTGTTMCDVDYNKWAAVPQTPQELYTVTGYHATADSSYWGWRIDVSNTQKTGIYTGNLEFTSIANLF